MGAFSDKNRYLCKIVVTDIPFFPSSDRNLVYFVVIVIASAVLSYVFYREIRSLNKTIKDIDEFAGKE